jgi:hypothetical protein
MSDNPESNGSARHSDPNREPYSPEPAAAPVLAGPIGLTPNAIDSAEAHAKAARWARLGDRRWRWRLPR